MYNEVPKVAVLLFISSDLGRYSVQRNEMHSATHRMRLSLVPKGFLNFCFHLVYLNHLHPNELGCSLLSKGSFSETKKRIEYPIARICAPSHKVQLFLLHNVIIYMFDSSRMNWDWIWLNFSNCDIIEKNQFTAKLSSMWKCNKLLDRSTVENTTAWRDWNLIEKNKIRKRSPFEKNHKTYFQEVILLHKLHFFTV